MNFYKNKFEQMSLNFFSQVFVRNKFYFQKRLATMQINKIFKENTIDLPAVLGRDVVEKSGGGV